MRSARRLICDSRIVLRRWKGVASLAAVLCLVIPAFAVRTSLVVSPSMESSLLVGDFVLVNRAVTGATIPLTTWRLQRYSPLGRGDVIVFRPPATDLVGADLVKRIVGLPGDTIRMRGSAVSVNDLQLKEPYARHTGETRVFDPRMVWQKQFLPASVDPRTYVPSAGDWGPLVIPPKHYFVMGDNRAASIDSRHWGFVADSQIEGRVAFVYFSYDRGSSRGSRWIDAVRWARIGHPIH